MYILHGIVLNLGGGLDDTLKNKITYGLMGRRDIYMVIVVKQTLNLSLCSL